MKKNALLGLSLNQRCENCKKAKNKSMASQVFLWITALVVFSMFVLNYSSNLF